MNGQDGLYIAGARKRISDEWPGGPVYRGRFRLPGTSSAKLVLQISIEIRIKVFVFMLVSSTGSLQLSLQY